MSARMQQIETARRAWRAFDAEYEAGVRCGGDPALATANALEASAKALRRAGWHGQIWEDETGRRVLLEDGAITWVVDDSGVHEARWDGVRLDVAELREGG